MQDNRRMAQLKQEIRVLESQLLSRRKELDDLEKRARHSNFDKMKWGAEYPRRWNVSTEAFL